MATIDLSRFAVGGATRPDSFTGLDPEFLGALSAMVGAAPPEIQQNLRILSAFRSPERQTQLWNEALAKYGSPDVARKWVAPPGRSKHNHGQAVDLRYLDDTAREWAHANAQNFGLHFPLSNENWHIEPIGARGGHNHAPAAAPQASGTPAPAMGPARSVVDRPIAAATPAPAAPPAPAPVQAPSDQGGLAPLMASLAPAAASMGGGGAGAPQASFGSGDPMAATMAAMQGTESARALRSALMPDVERLMGLGKRVG